MTLLEHVLKRKDGRPETKKCIFIFGISGFVGKRLANFCATKLRTEFVEVGGTTRVVSSSSSLEYTEYILGENGELSPEALAALKRATHVLSTVPTNTDDTLDDGVIEYQAKRGVLQWAGYLSTTATYGDRGGSLANEDDDIDELALSERGLARLRTEEKWRKTGAPVHVFRLPGIYGPGRGPLAKAREPSNRLLVKENQVFCRVHVDDIVQALVLSMRKPNPGRIYNVCDNEPAPSHVVSSYAYKLLDKQAPPLVRFEDVEKDLSPMLRSFYSECKRVHSDRAKLELGFFPVYPTYREGFIAQVEEERVDFKAVPVSSSLPVKQFTSRTERIRRWTNAARAVLALLAHFLASLYRAVRFWLFTKLYGCTVLLVDNGSVRPGATLGMRRLASRLEKRLGLCVVPTSWRYADRIDQAVLEGEKATMFAKALEEQMTRFVVILPLFLGASSIVTKDIPKLLSRSTQIVASPLVDMDSGRCELTTLLSNAALTLLQGKPLTRTTKILLVDHGSPKFDVNMVRRALAARLRAQLYPARVIDCSMERREEPEYDFNEPTLQNAFELGGLDQGEVIVVPAFLFPGNHAGPGGDIETIIAEIMQRKAGLLQVRLGRLIMDEANDDIVVNILESRVRSALL